MILPIYIYGSTVLREPAQTITKDYPQIETLIENMFETMKSADGVGIAAPQVGLSIDLFCIDLSHYKEDYPADFKLKRVFINSEIYEESEECEAMEEGCLSLPGINEKVNRPYAIRIKYQDENFMEHDEEFEDFMARVIQHEYDHLNGMVFTDRLSPIRKNLVKSKLTTLSKGKFSTRYRTKQQ